MDNPKDIILRNRKEENFLPPKEKMHKFSEEKQFFYKNYLFPTSPRNDGCWKQACNLFYCQTHLNFHSKQYRELSMEKKHLTWSKYNKKSIY